jgi:hypothetical protein
MLENWGGYRASDCAGMALTLGWLAVFVSRGVVTNVQVAGTLPASGYTAARPLQLQERREFGGDVGGDVDGGFFGLQVVAGVFDCEKMMAGGDLLDR